MTRHSMVRTSAAAALVIAAMAIGQVLTNHGNDDDALDIPFVRTGTVGETVHLRYGDVRGTGVRIAQRLEGSDVVIAAGRFVVVDFRVVALGEPRTFAGLELRDSHGRRYAETSRVTGCAPSVTGSTAVPLYAMACFDVPKSALAGATFRLSRGDYGTRGSGQRRDDLADIDLGIRPSDVDRLWNRDLGYETFSSSTQPLPHTRIGAQP